MYVAERGPGLTRVRVRHQAGRPSANTKLPTPLVVHHKRLDLQLRPTLSTRRLETAVPAPRAFTPRSSVQASEVRSVLRRKHALPTAMSRKTILICDDEETMRQLVRVVLDGHYLFEEATDGASALELARRLRPDLVI